MNVVRDEALAQWAASDPQVAGQIGGRVLAREAGWSESLVAALDLIRREGTGQGSDDLRSTACAMASSCQGPLVARALAAVFEAEPDAVAHALALTDAWRVVDLLERRGPVGLNEVRLAPLVPLHPALAGGHTGDLKRFPVWAERKYDGVRIMLHKSTDERGTVMCGAYTRNRRDWMETVPDLEASIRALPCRGAIVDGELFGHVVDGHGVRPATVYEVFQMLQGEARRPVRLRFAAFDLVWVDGHDLTSSPWQVRRAALERLVRPITTLPLTVPMTVAESQMASRVDDLNRLYQHFRSQGHEGLITKDPEGAYRLAGRDPEWRKRKPEVTLDLALLGAIFAVTQKERVGLFGSYVLGARTPEGAFVDVGDVAGLDRARDAQIQADIAREGLLTGRRIERQGVAGVATGLDLRPHIVVTVRFEGLVAPSEEGGLPHLRDPKIVAIRADKPVGECDTTRDLEDLMTRQRWA